MDEKCTGVPNAGIFFSPSNAEARGSSTLAFFVVVTKAVASIDNGSQFFKKAQLCSPEKTLLQGSSQ